MSSIKIRPATTKDAAAISEIQLASLCEDYGNIVSQSFLDSLRSAHALAERADGWRQAVKWGGLIFVAESEGKPVGFARGGTFMGESAELRGELYTLHVLAGYRRRGAGKMLLEHMRSLLCENGWYPFGIWAVADMPACLFYEKMGGKIAQERWQEFGGQTHKEILFSWQ